GPRAVNRVNDPVVAAVLPLSAELLAYDAMIGKFLGNDRTNRLFGSLVRLCHRIKADFILVGDAATLTETRQSFSLGGCSQASKEIRRRESRHRWQFLGKPVPSGSNKHTDARASPWTETFFVDNCAAQHKLISG